MKSLISYPKALKSELGLRRHRKRAQRELRREVTRLRSGGEPVKVIIGSGPRQGLVGAKGTPEEGWLITDVPILNALNPADWAAIFEPESIDRLLSEHMLEHLSETEGRIALSECYRYLKSGGLFRLAVPDGYRRDAAYLAEASPPRAGHQVLYNIDTLTPLLESIGFVVTPLEYFDVREQFQARPWDERDGHIQRSLLFDTQEEFRRGDMCYTSLIMDARKA
jgi:predicted SAM-dependent methyltransferase